MATKTRNLQRTRKDILDVAFLEVYARGFQGVSIDDIVRKTSLTKGAFYHHFPTKLELGYALVDEVIRPLVTERWIKPLDTFENPLEGILTQMKELIGKSPAAHLKLGCPLNNLVQEMSPVDEGFKTRLKSALNYWIAETNRHLIRAKKAGLIRDDVDTRQVARFVVMAHEGFYGLLKGLDEPKIFESLFSALQSYFESISAR